MQEIANGVYVETGFRGGNVAAILTEEGFILIDAPPFPDDARRWKMVLRDKSDLPIRAMIMTDGYRDRLLGACWFQPPMLVSHAATYAAMSSLPASYVNTVVNSLTRDPLELSSFSSAQLLLPNFTFTEKMILHFGDPALFLSYHPGPTKGSIWVQLPEQSIVFTGDSVVVDTAPYVTSNHTKDWLDALALIDEADFPANTLIPGRGQITDKSAIDPIVKFLSLSRDRVKTLYQTHRPLSETAILVHELLAFFPPPLESELEMVQQRVRTALQCVYNEFREAETTDLSNQEEYAGF